MGIIKDNKKFDRSKTQNDPTNPSPNLKENKDFSLDKETITDKKKDQ
ncbi:hypothetical protein [Polaribacter sp. Hel_I_88]|nr:hypothetical protein [Polaribacter sp. Hel_I_88]